MLCEDCGQRPATVHITKLVNNQKSEYHLCEECARRRNEGWEFLGFGDPGFSLEKFLAGLLAQEPGWSSGPGVGVGGALRCRRCGLSYEQFREMGRLGCDECYRSFGEQLVPLLRRLHGSAQHVGKAPKRTAGRLGLVREIERLRLELQELVAKEEFEKAAQVRDRIRELERQAAGSQ
ncbi:MAG: UvrB/UvrC motif-containing protein [Moorellales bacterium]